MHVVIGGYGRVGRYLAHELEAQGHTVAVVDRNPDVFEEFESIHGLRLTGEVFDRSTLMKAGIERAGAFAACTSGDSSNIISARIARERFHVPLVVARIFDPKSAVIFEQFGIPTVSAVQWSSSRLLAMLLDPDAPSEFAFGRGEVVILDAEVTPALAGKRVLDVELPRVLSIIAVEREGCAVMLTDIDELKLGDHMYLAVDRAYAPELPKLLAGE
jgi:trk system potassium uptake protein TrkA